MSNQPKQIADLGQPIYAKFNGKGPNVLQVVTSQPVYAGGGQMPSEQLEHYVKFSCLPAELQERVKTAIEMLSRTG